MTDATAPTSGETLTFGQTLKSSDFVGLGIKNGLLNIVTLGIYSFWAKTATRRSIWEKVSLNGEAFSYTGNGGELFRGFLLGMLALFAPYMAVVILTVINKLFMLLIFPLYIALIVALGAAVFMAFRYVAGRTRWRGNRFQLMGSPVKFGWSYLGCFLLFCVTLGWFAPAMSMRLSGKLWGSLSYGDKKLEWQRSAKENLYGPFTLAWLVGVAGYVGLIAMILSSMPTQPTGGVPDFAFIGRIYAFMLVYILAATLASAWYYAALMRAVVGAIRVDDARFAITVKAIDLIVLSLTNVLILIFSLGFLLPVVEARSARFVLSRLSSTGKVDLSNVRQAPPSSGADEGLADALGISTF
ncbi:YjgN family protein [Caulobacter sp.]|uniref:YjgN family protein n=1 Tax=Caulobacter sp. TaxID=78 RepID=UPI003BAF01B5